MDWILYLCLIFLAGGACGFISCWKMRNWLDEFDRNAAVITNRFEHVMPPRLPHPAQLAREEMEKFMRDATKDL